MADYIMRAQCNIAMTSGIPNDEAVNVWHFLAANLTTPALSIETALKAFYNSISTLYPAAVAQNGHRIRQYRLDEPEPRAPVRDTFWNLTNAPTGTDLPPELCVCLSFQGARVSGQDQARRRGRVYLGPLDSAQVTGGLTGSGVRTTIAAAATALLTASASSGDWEWSVYSRKDQATVPVTNGWIDNAVDVQRRRGLAATSRTVW